MRSFLVSTLGLFLFLSTATLQAEELGHTADPLETVKKNVSDGKAVLVDVRSLAEWNKGFIEGALHLPVDQVQRGSGLDALPKDKVIYTYCVVGKRSLAAGRVLQQKGFDVRVLKPGYQDLLKAGFGDAKP